MEDKAESNGRRIKLYCPSASKIAQIMAWEDQKLDLGTIARMFGIEPSTLKLNGHFISRGVDLIASSVTWKSLLSFFSSRGLSTGTHDSGALIVDGKLSKCGTKRMLQSPVSLPMFCEFGLVIFIFQGEAFKNQGLDGLKFK